MDQSRLFVHVRRLGCVEHTKKNWSLRGDSINSTKWTVCGIDTHIGYFEVGGKHRLVRPLEAFSMPMGALEVKTCV